MKIIIMSNSGMKHESCVQRLSMLLCHVHSEAKSSGFSFDEVFKLAF